MKTLLNGGVIDDSRDFYSSSVQEGQLLESLTALVTFMRRMGNESRYNNEFTAKDFFFRNYTIEQSAKTYLDLLTLIGMCQDLY